MLCADASIESGAGPPPKRQRFGLVHAVALMALWRTTLSDLYRVVHSNTAWHTNSPRDVAQNVPHKRRKTEGPPALELPANVVML